MNISKISDIIKYQLENYPLERSISGKREDNSSYSYSTKEIKELADRFSTGLLRRGLKKGDKISLISFSNIPEWNIADLGMLQTGAVNVAVYPNISPENYVYIFNNAKIKYCIAGNGFILEKVLEAQRDVPSLEKIFTFGDPGIEKDYNNNPIENWNVLLEKDADTDQIEKAYEEFDEDTLATIIYTSGTTGNPKGVMLSHRNIVSNVKNISNVMLLEKGEAALSYLPLCHGFERTMVYCYILKGIEITYAFNQQTIGRTIPEVQPHILTAVPRVLEKIYEKINLSMQKASFPKRKLFFWAEGLSQKYDFNRHYGIAERIQYRIADKFVYSRIRKIFGGRIKVLAVGASACPQKLLKFFCAAGIPVREGYGLTETSAVLSVNHMPEKEAMIGTVGIVLPGFEIKIKDTEGIYAEGEGEILVRGKCVTSGYYNDPENTAETFDEEGWLKTGDIGKFVKNTSGIEFIQLTNRIKDLFKTSNGKYISPVPVENMVKESSFVSQIIVLGERRKYVSALIIPDFEILKEWCNKKKIKYSELNDLSDNPLIQENYKMIIKDVNVHLSGYEQIRKFRLLKNSWSVETDELTPTLKLKRNFIENKYSEVIEEMYESDYQKIN